MTDGARALRIQLVIGFMCVALVFYFVMLGRIAMAFITSGRPAAIGLGLALMILPLIGIWVMVSTLRAGLAHQRLARIIKEEGMELDVSSLPRMPSGRIQRDAADALLREQVHRMHALLFRQRLRNDPSGVAHAIHRFAERVEYGFFHHAGGQHEFDPLQCRSDALHFLVQFVAVFLGARNIQTGHKVASDSLNTRIGKDA